MLDIMLLSSLDIWKEDVDFWNNFLPLITILVYLYNVINLIFHTSHNRLRSPF